MLQAGSHAKFKCYICAQMVPDMKTMQVSAGTSSLLPHVCSRPCALGHTICQLEVTTVKVTSADVHLQVHFEAKHPKLPYEADKVVDMHALMGGTTQGVAIRGSTKKK